MRTLHAFCLLLRLSFLSAPTPCVFLLILCHLLFSFSHLFSCSFFAFFLSYPPFRSHKSTFLPLESYNTSVSSSDWNASQYVTNKSCQLGILSESSFTYSEPSAIHTYAYGTGDEQSYKSISEGPTYAAYSPIGEYSSPGDGYSTVNQGSGYASNATFLAGEK